MVAQGLAARRPDLVGAVVVSNTAARMGTVALRAERIAAVREGGVGAIADAVIARWFGPEAPGGLVREWRGRLAATPPEGYAGRCAAIVGADLREATAGLRLPTLGIAGARPRLGARGGRRHGGPRPRRAAGGDRGPRPRRPWPSGPRSPLLPTLDRPVPRCRARPPASAPRPLPRERRAPGVRRPAAPPGGARRRGPRRPCAGPGRSAPLRSTPPRPPRRR